jgi:hypothetical protein
MQDVNEYSSTAGKVFQSRFGQDYQERKEKLSQELVTLSLLVNVHLKPVI